MSNKHLVKLKEVIFRTGFSSNSMDYIRANTNLMEIIMDYESIYGELPYIPDNPEIADTNIISDITSWTDEKLNEAYNETLPYFIEDGFTKYSSESMTRDYKGYRHPAIQLEIERRWIENTNS